MDAHEPEHNRTQDDEAEDIAWDKICKIMARK
jgi:hypothetical protein